MCNIYICTKDFFVWGFTQFSYTYVYCITIGSVVSRTLITGIFNCVIIAPLALVSGQATPSLLIGVVLSPRTDMWGAVTNTGYDGMPTSLGIVQTLIQSLGRRSAADKLRVHTSQCSSVSVADITDSATSPALRFFLQLTKESFVSFPLLLSFHYSIYFGSLIHEITSLCV